MLGKDSVIIVIFANIVMIKQQLKRKYINKVPVKGVNVRNITIASETKGGWCGKEVVEIHNKLMSYKSSLFNTVCKQIKIKQLPYCRGRGMTWSEGWSGVRIS